MLNPTVVSLERQKLVESPATPVEGLFVPRGSKKVLVRDHDGQLSRYAFDSVWTEPQILRWAKIQMITVLRITHHDVVLY